MNAKPFDHKIWLSSPTMHGEELKYVTEAYETNWMSTVGENINQCEKMACEKVGCEYAVGLSCGTAALHLALKLAGVSQGDTVFSSDVTFAATCNPIVYEKATPVFIDTERDTWNMDPMVLEKAFELYPNTKIVVMANLYGTPAKMDEVLEVCKKHGATLIEDAAESLGATYKGKQTGSFGAFNVISFNGNKIITGSSGGMLLSNDKTAAEKARKWSTQSRENAPWYEHEEIGYNYRMSNVIAGVVRGQFPYLEEHIRLKKEIYLRYREGLKDLPVAMNPYDEEIMEPNFWLSCITVNEDAMAPQKRVGLKAEYEAVKGKSCPTEILERLASINAEGRPIWKPMHLQPIFASYPFVTRSSLQAPFSENDVGSDLFRRGLCLPSDVKMTKDEQDVIIDVIRSCFA